MSKLLALVPSWVPIAAIGVLLAGLVGGYFVLRASWQAEGAARVEAQNAKAIVAQKEQDAKTSAQQIERLQGRVDQINATAAPTIKEIRYVPVTATCGPAVGAAADGVRALLAAPGGPPARPQPAAAVRAPPAAAGAGH